MHVKIPLANEKTRARIYNLYAYTYPHISTVGVLTDEIYMI